MAHSGSLEDPKIEYKSIDFDEELVAVSKVWRGKRDKGPIKEEVIIKETTKDHPQIKIHRLKHRNIVQLLGVIDDQPSHFYIVLEFVEVGSLYDFLHKAKHTPNHEQTLRWPREIAAGMEFLHHERKIHRDLKSKSVLLTTDLTVKLSGFGSTDQFKPEVLQKLTSSYRWMAPEVHNGDRVNQACDVFSFGIVLWEIRERKLPFEEFLSDDQIKTQIAAGKTPAIPESYEDYLKKLLWKCWETNPKTRPTFSEVLSELRKGLLQDNNLQISEGDIIMPKDIQSGSTVFRAFWKTRNIDVTAKVSVERTLRECTILHKLQHPNIERLYGVVNRKPSVLLILECSKISLYDLVYKDTWEPTPTETEQWPKEIADGMKYLHHQGVAHRNLSSKNVLLSSAGSIKLTGFDLSKEIERDVMNTLFVDSDQRWTPPEMIEGTGDVNAMKCDAFSFGMVLYEIHTCRLPYEGCKSADIMKHIVEQKLPTESHPLPSDCPPHISELLQHCWKEPKERPDFATIVLHLKHRGHLTKTVGDFPLKDLDWNEDKPISSGGQAQVFKGQWISRDVTVAIKRRNIDSQCTREVEILNRLDHPNIIRYFGAAKKSAQLHIITEFADKGSLHDCLIDKVHDPQEFTLKERLEWAKEIAQGLEYLHRMKIIHKDLKPRNVLLLSTSSGFWNAKICDLGIAKKYDITAPGTMAGTLRWIAPELLQGEGISLSYDVYTFGLVLWVLVTCKEPYLDIHPSMVTQRVIKEDRPEIPESCDPKWAQLMKDCWGATPKGRPTSEKIVAILSSDDAGGSLQKSDVERITEKLQDIAIMWYPLGNMLKLSRDDLIMNMDPNIALKSVITKWICTADPSPTVEALAECVSNVSDREDLAKALLKEFGK